MPRRADIRRLSSKKTRLTKTKRDELRESELKSVLTRALLIGDEGLRLEEITDGTLSNRVTYRHWYLEEDAWHIPGANGGGRELVFLAFVGAIHKRSVMRKTCGDAQCVNPFHVSILDKVEAKERSNGTWEKRMVAPEGRIVKQKEYENTLCDALTKEKRRQARVLEAKAAR